MQPDDGAGAGHAEIVRQCVVLGLWIVVAAGCSEGNGELREGPELGSGSGAPACAERSAGLTLPEGFCATIFADDVEGARHLVERADGTVFVLRTTAPEDSGGVLALRDTTGDGRADIRVSFAPFVRGTGIALNDTSLFVDASSSVVRFTIAPGAMEPTIAPDTIVRELPRGGHDALALALDGRGGLFVNVGSRSNSCQQTDRREGSPGEDPCPELESRAGIWRFEAAARNQRQEDGVRWATGIRNALAIGLDRRDRLWVVQHGRDQLHQSWQRYFSEEESAENPAEELLLVARGDDFGWPYCYFSREHGRKVLAPEYGGTGRGEVGRCSEAKSAAATFPAHWAPMDLLFYDGEQFPARYRSGVFVSFHGSWNRAPLPQQGFSVVFLPMGNGDPAAEYEIFAGGFSGSDSIARPGEASHRPVGLAQASDGGMYVTDDHGGRIWKITYRGGA